jgi:membrane protease YdiL (CAAX protease family)
MSSSPEVKPALPVGQASTGSLIKFFLLAYALMWVCFFTVAWARIPAYNPLHFLLLMLGTFSPSLAALWLTAQAEGRAGVNTLLERVVRWQVPWRWYVFALVYIVVIKLVVAVIHRFATGAWPPFGTLPLYMIPLAILVSTPFQSGEEIGWRGYALPRMARRLGLGGASLLLGVIWGVWHLPQFFILDTDTYQQSFILFVLQVTAVSVAMAWLYAHTKGSLLLTMIMHAAINNSKDIVPSAVPGGTGMFGLKSSLVAWLTVAVL